MRETLRNLQRGALVLGLLLLAVNTLYPPWLLIRERTIARRTPTGEIVIAGTHSYTVPRGERDCILWGHNRAFESAGPRTLGQRVDWRLWTLWSGGIVGVTAVVYGVLRWLAGRYPEPRGFEVELSQTGSRGSGGKHQP